MVRMFDSNQMVGILQVVGNWVPALVRAIGPCNAMTLISDWPCIDTGDAKINVSSVKHFLQSQNLTNRRYV